MGLCGALKNARAGVDERETTTTRARMEHGAEAEHDVAWSRLCTRSDAREMMPLVWAQTKSTGRGRPAGAGAIEASTTAPAEREANGTPGRRKEGGGRGLWPWRPRPCGVEEAAHYADAGADLPWPVALENFNYLCCVVGYVLPNMRHSGT